MVHKGGFPMWDGWMVEELMRREQERERTESAGIPLYIEADPRMPLEPEPAPDEVAEEARRVIIIDI
jgi:hypothetical protein